MSELLAGFIGGSTVDLAQVHEEQGKIRLLQHRSYVSRSFSDLDAILKLYLRKSKITFSAACLGVAGPVIRNEVSTTNLPWHITGHGIEKAFSLNQVKLINDVVATAYGLSELSSDRFFTINRGARSKDSNLGVIAAGSGLGEALIYRDGNTLHPYASEGGHADFAPGSQLEAELREYVYAEQNPVEAEDIVSLPGLERIFNFLVDMHGCKRGAWFEKADDRPAAIIERGLSDKDATASHALDVFIDCYASEAANLALKGMTLGGVYLGGVIAPQIITALDKGRFMERFVKRGKMETMLAAMPVYVIIEEKAPLLGAARVALGL